MTFAFIWHHIFLEFFKLLQQSFVYHKFDLVRDDRVLSESEADFHLRLEAAKGVDAIPLGQSFCLEYDCTLLALI